jgi:hypothetical protein
MARDVGLAQALGAARCGDRIRGEDQSDEAWGLSEGQRIEHLPSLLLSHALGIVDVGLPQTGEAWKLP